MQPKKLVYCSVGYGEYLGTGLMIYALVHMFISQVIEGDELYTKVNQNVPAEESEGWTIMLMERASRFIWALGCGKKDRTLLLYSP